MHSVFMRCVFRSTSIMLCHSASLDTSVAMYIALGGVLENTITLDIFP